MQTVLHASQNHPMGKDMELVINKADKLLKNPAALQTYLNQFEMSHDEVKDIIKLIYLAKIHYQKVDQKNLMSDELFKKAKNKAVQLNNKSLLFWVNIKEVEYLYFFRRIELIMPQLFEASEYARGKNQEPVIQAAQSYKLMGWVFTNLESKDDAIYFLEKALENADQNSSEYATILSNLSQLYIIENQLSKATTYVLKASKLALQVGDSLRYAKTLGDYASILSLKGIKKEAIALYKKDILISEKLHEDQNTMYATLQLAKLLFDHDKKEAAFTYLAKAEKIANSKNYFKETKLEVFQLKLKYQEFQTADQELAVIKEKESIEKELQITEGVTIKKAANWVIQKNKYLQDIEKSNIKYAETVKQNRLIIILLACLVLLISFIVINYKKKLAINQLKFDQKLLNYKNQQLKLENDLHEANSSLNNQITYLRNKNSQIQKLKLEMEEFKNTIPQNVQINKSNLQDILDSHLMTDKNWNQFKNQFILEYPDFYNKLIREYTDLTPANMRIVLLQYLKFKNSEIASLLGITVEAVKKAKQRLKKKLGNGYEELIG